MILKNYSEPKLYIANGGDLSQKWFVYYTFFNPAKGNMQRVRHYKPINEYHTTDERVSIGKAIIAELSLKRGFNPFNTPENLYFPATAFVKLPKVKKDKSKTVDYYLDLAYTIREAELRPKSKDKYKSHIRKFCYWLDENGYAKIDILDLTKEICQAFLNNITAKSATTRNGYLAVLKVLFNVLISDDIISKNPFAKIKKLRENRTGAIPFNPMQTQIIKNYLVDSNPQLWVLLQLQFYCFIRPGEARCLRIENIDFYANTIIVPANISKNKRTQTVVIPKQFVDILKKHCSHCTNIEYYLFGKTNEPGPTQVTRDCFNKQHRAMLKELNIITKHKLYSWKHTGAKQAALGGVNIKQLQLQLRHSNLETMDIYLRTLGVSDCADVYNNFPTL